jgi:hypothetical protein
MGPRQLSPDARGASLGRVGIQVLGVAQGIGTLTTEEVEKMGGGIATIPMDDQCPRTLRIHQD